VVRYSPAMSELGQKRPQASRACLDISVACRDLTHALQQNGAFNHLRGGSQAHYGSRVQYALRTERYACAASSNPFLDTAVNTTPTRNGLPSLSVSAVVATRSNGRPRRLGPLWVCSVVTGVVSCSVFTVARGVSPNSQRGGRGQTCGRIQSTGGRTEHAR